ncbi:GHMP kinase [Akkermansiaceae bacterium]|nr:GHMP kinase [Akkermansiaceae bacterium]
MIFRSRAPLRIGLAGGGTDVSPYSDLFGGAVLNTTITLFAHASIEPIEGSKIVFEAKDRSERVVLDWQDEIPIDKVLPLHKGIHNQLVKVGLLGRNPYKLSTFVEAPAGSGLGTSSTLTVAILGAFQRWLGIPYGEYDTAQLAYRIERGDLRMAGGKQDQFAATFGGFNFMEFFSDERVIVNPLRIGNTVRLELAHNLLLFYTQKSRDSALIIKEQQKNIDSKSEDAIEATHRLKEQAVMMKEALLLGKVDQLGDIFHYGWQNKKKMAAEITNPQIDEIYQCAMDNGASGGKISGAGGGGFMVFYAPKNSRHSIVRALKNIGVIHQPYQFTNEGLTTWQI